jgi:hypothetical protein
VPPGAVAGEIESGGATTTSIGFIVPDMLLLLVARTVRVKLPVTEGIPLIVEPLVDNPAGNPEMLQVNGPWPPDAVNETV